MPGIEVLCFWNSMNWVPIGNLSSPTFTFPNLGNAAATTISVSGTLDGQIAVFRDTSMTVAVGAKQREDHFNQNLMAGAAVTYNLPAPAAGRKYCFFNSNSGTAADHGLLTVKTAGSSDVIIWTDGTNGSMNGNVHLTTGVGGESICIEGLDGSHWQVVGPPVGSWSRT
jgi:hypothetical protein